MSAQLSIDSTSTNSNDTVRGDNRERRITRSSSISSSSTMSTTAPKRKHDDPKSGTDTRGGGEEEKVAAAKETTPSKPTNDKKTKITDGEEAKITVTAATTALVKKTKITDDEETKITDTTPIANAKTNDDETKTRKEEEEGVAKETKELKEDSKSGKDEKDNNKDGADTNDDDDEDGTGACSKDGTFPFSDAEEKKLQALLEKMFESECEEVQMTGCTIRCPLTGLSECFCKCGPHLLCPEHSLNCMCHWNGDFSRIENADLDPLLVKFIKWRSSGF